MKQKRLETTFKEYDNNGDLVNEVTSVVLELTPDEGKCFIDTRKPDEKIIRQSDGKGAVIEIPAENLQYYEEQSIED